MTRYAIALALPIALVAAAVPPAQATGDLATVQRYLQSVETMTADFNQTDRNGKVLTGTFALKKPGKLRFQYEKGVPILIVADGGSLWFLDYSVGQKQRWPIKNSPLAVLLDQSFDISQYAKLIPTFNDNIISLDVYDKKHPEYGRINLVFSRKNQSAALQLQGWVMVDSQNNRTTVRLTNQHVGIDIPNSRFRWNDPAARIGR